MSKKDKVFSYIIFFFGIVLLVFSLGILIYQTVHVVISIDWAHLGEEYKETRNYVIVEYITILFKLVISFYAINAIRNLDDTLNPLFTFTCLYFVFVILQTILFFSNGGFTLGELVSAKAIIDIIVSVLIFGISFVLKLDDWRNID